MIPAFGSRLSLRIGLLGGSFNPAHAAHREISLTALHRLKLDCVWWLVSPQNPLKDTDGMAPLAQRLRGAEAVASHPRIRVTAVESRLGTRYTADTLQQLRRHYPNMRFVWLMGADNLVQLPKWRRWTEIFRLVPIAVFDRPAYAHAALTGQAARRFRCAQVPPRALAAADPPAWAFIRIRTHPASATAIRAARRWPS